MIISQCPRCHERFRVPSGLIPEDAYAHCPWCRETFPIADVLSSLPPQLEIVSADGKPLALGRSALGEPTNGIGSSLQVVESSGSLPVSGSFGALTRRQRDSRQPESGIDSFELSDDDDIHATIADEPITETIVDDDWNRDLDESSLEISDDHDGDDPYSTWDGSKTSPLQSMNVATKSGSRKRKGSGVGTFVGIVLGGLASVPIAGGLLSLMGRTPDWGFWPFQGEQVSSTSVRAAPLPDSDARLSPTPTATGTPLPFDRDESSLESPADPTLLAAQQIIDADDSDADGRNTDDSDATDNSASAQTMRVSDTADPVAGDQVGSQQGNTAQADYSAVIPEDETEPPGTAESQDQEISSTESVRSLAPTESDSSAVAEQPATVPATTVPAATVATRTAEPSSDAEELALKASQMMEVMSQFQGEEKERNRRIGVTYQTIASAASLAVESGEFLESLAGKIIASPLREDIRSAGWDWLAYANRPSDGIALIGRAIASDDGEFLTNASGERIALISQGEIPQDQEVLVLGRLIDQGSSLRVVYAQPIP